MDACSVTMSLMRRSRSSAPFCGNARWSVPYFLPEAPPKYLDRGVCISHELAHRIKDLVEEDLHARSANCQPVPQGAHRAQISRPWPLSPAVDCQQMIQVRWLLRHTTLYMLSHAKYRTLLSVSLKHARTGGTMPPRYSAILGPSAILKPASTQLPFPCPPLRQPNCVGRGATHETPAMPMMPPQRVLESLLVESVQRKAMISCSFLTSSVA